MSSKELKLEVESLQETFKLTDFEALQIVVQREHIAVYKEANCMGYGNHPVALEKQAMMLESIKDALYNR